jgi:hypothetical protein
MTEPLVAQTGSKCERVKMKPVLLLSLLSLSACSSDAGSAPDAGVDAGRDAAVDAGMDAGADASSDAGADAGMDGGLDAGTDAGIDAGLSERRIFVTSSVQNAGLGGFDGADALCASEAAEAGLEGEFKAWLSTEAAAAADRLVQSTVPYVLVDGSLVADDWADLTDMSLETRINLDASGVERTGDVWTGTLPSGLSYVGQGDCDGFTNGSDGAGLCGSTQSINSQWTASQLPGCSTRLRLYCIEQ